MEVEMGRDGIKLDTNISKQPQCKKTIKQCLESLERKKCDLGILQLATSRCLKHERTEWNTQESFLEKKKIQPGLPWWLSVKSKESTCQCRRHGVPSLVWEYPTCCRAIKAMCHNHWACALEPESRSCWNLHALEPILRNKKSHRRQKPACTPQLQSSPCSRN